MTSLSKIRPCLAALLLLSLTMTIVLRAAHSLFLHECHNHGRLHCSTETEGKGTHIHDERFSPNDCSLCEFVFQACSFSLSPSYTLRYEAIPATIVQPIYEVLTPRLIALDAAPSRGPPC